MARQIEIHVTGLAFCFIRDGMWHLIFVSDDVHGMTLVDPAGNKTPLRRGTDDLLCEFIGNLKRDNSPIHFPTNRIPNLSEQFAHDGNLVLERSNNFGTGLLCMQLPEARLSAPGPDTKEDCHIQEVKIGGGGRKKNLGRVSTKIEFRFAVESDAPLEVAVTNMTSGGDVYRETFPTDPGQPMKFAFDNGCGNDCTHNDSIDLYDMMTDRRGNGLQFVSGIDRNGVPGNDPSERSALLKESPTFGNCDPNGGDPPPGGTWPPG